jgi:hypothetical protein
LATQTGLAAGTGTESTAGLTTKAITGLATGFTC